MRTLIQHWTAMVPGREYWLEVAQGQPSARTGAIPTIRRQGIYEEAKPKRVYLRDYSGHRFGVTKENILQIDEITS